MEQQKLPNSQAILILGIASIPFCCCYGIVGLALGIVAMVLAKKAITTYNENPELYTDIKNVKLGKTLAMIGIALSLIMLLITLYLNFFVAEETILEWQKQLEEMRQAQEG